MGLTGESTTTGNLLPPLPSAEYFNYPLLAKVVETYWANPQYPTLGAAFLPTLKDTDPRIVFESRELFRDYPSDIESDDFDPDQDATLLEDMLPPVIDLAHADLTVDEAGMIVAQLGSVVDFKRRAVKLLGDKDSSIPVDVNFEEMLEYYLFNAFVRTQGSYDDANTLIQRYLDEQNRRIKLNEMTESDNLSAPGHEPLF